MDADALAPIGRAVLTPALSSWVIATFGLLAAAMLTVWAPRVTTSPSARSWWVLPFAATLLLAQGAGLVDTAGLAALFALVTACRLGSQAPEGALRGFALAVMLAMSAGLLAHALPGFTNPRVLDGVRLSADSASYTKYLNFDKGVLGLFLIGLYAPERALRRAPRAALIEAAWRFAVVGAAVMALTVAVGYAHWDPKVPSWWPLWLGSMIFLTALPEEALFRHVIQDGLHHWLGDSPRAQWTAMLGATALFGLSHLAGGWTYVGLATAAGLGYGLVYAITGSVAATVAAHTALNLLHLLLFSYPSLASAG